MGFGIGDIGIGPTPVAILVVVLLLALLTAVVLVGLSQAGGRLVDKRWPADEPLTPSEVLWGETGNYVAKNFPGLDPVIARDLTQYLVTRKAGPGESIVEPGDLPTHYVVVKSGELVVTDPAKPEPVTLKAGSSFGGEAILRRQPSTVAVRTKGPAELLVLSAEDYLAGVALGVQEEDDNYILNTLADYFHDETAPAPPSGAVPPPPPPRWAAATHRVGAGDGLAGYVLPEGTDVLRTLPAGTLVQRFEGLPGWAHVRTEDGWEGWVREGGLAPVS